VGFEPTIPAFERAKTIDAVDRAAAAPAPVIGRNTILLSLKRRNCCVRPLHRQRVHRWGHRLEASRPNRGRAARSLVARQEVMLVTDVDASFERRNSTRPAEPRSEHDDMVYVEVGC
jgi:hypothetical protein